MKDFDSRMQTIFEAHGLDAMKHMLARGDFVNGQEVKAQAFIQKKEKEALSTYVHSPEYASIRQANAAEKSNRIAIASLVVAALAFAVAATALVLQFTTKR